MKIRNRLAFRFITATAILVLFTGFVFIRPQTFFDIQEEWDGYIIDPIPNCEEKGTIVEIYTEKKSLFPIATIEERNVFVFDTGHEETIPTKYLQQADPAFLGWEKLGIGDQVIYDVFCPDQKAYFDNQNKL